MVHEINTALSDLPPQETLGVKQVVDRLRDQITVEPVMLTAGEPSIEIPEEILAQLKEGGKKTRYADAKGLPVLKNAVAAYVSGYSGIDFTSEDILVVSGGRLAGYNLMQAVKAGIVAHEPFWPGFLEASHVDGALGLSGDRYGYILRDADFSISATELDRQLTELASRFRAAGMKQVVVVENEPGNPVPVLSTAAQVEERADVYVRHPEVMVHADDVYRELAFDPATEVPSIANAYVAAGGAPENVTILFSASKVFGVPGWRMAAIASKDSTLLKAMQAVGSRVSYTSSTPAQYAVGWALENGVYKKTARAICAISQKNFSTIEKNLADFTIHGEKAFSVIPAHASIYAALQGNSNVFEGATYSLNGETKKITATADLHEWLILNGVVAINASSMSPKGHRDYLFRLSTAASSEAVERALGYLHNPTYPLQPPKK